MSAKNTPATTAATATAQRVAPQVAAAAAAATEAAAAGASPQMPIAGSAGVAAAVLPGGQVMAVEGSAWLQVPGQAPQVLSAGTSVPPGAVMLAAADAVVRLSRPQSVGAKAAAKGGLDKLIADFDKGVGDTATAAGLAGGDETTAEGGLRVDRVSEATTTAGLGSNGSGSGSNGAEFPTAGTAGGSPNGTTPTTPPVIVLDNPGLTGDATPRISGSTDLPPGSLISVTVTDANGQVQIITATVGSDGRFAVDTAPLPDGNFSVNVQAENTTVTTGGTVDTTPPTLRLDPVAITGDNSPAISGQSNLPTGSTVRVTVVDAAGKSQELTATIGSDGRFSVSPGQNLTDGRYTVQVVATDAAGNAQTNTTTGVVDTKAPAVSVDAPDLSNSQQPTVSGRTDLPSGTPIEVKITDANGQTQTAQATVRPDGSFSLKPSTPLPDGQFTVEVTGRDAAGNPSTSTSNGTVDCTAPLSPSIGSVVDDHGPIQGKLNPGGATDDSRPTINGTAEPGSTITVYTNGVPVGTTTVAPNGTWSFTPEVPLPAGPNSITTTATDPAGNTGPSSQPFGFTVDVGAPQVPSIISATDNVTPVEGLLTKGSGTNDNTPSLNGYGRPGETVTLFADGQAVGTTVVNAKGEWSITPSALADKTWAFTAEAVNIHGVHSPVTGAWPLTIDTQAPRQVALDSVTDNAGPVRGEITEGSTTDDATPTWQGKNAEPGSTITVYDKGVALGSTTVGPDGTWRFTPPIALPDGPHSLTVTATDAVGNVSPATPPLSFSIDTSQVLSPTIDSVTEAGATGEVPMAFNQASNDTTPTLSGSGKPNQLVQVFDGETLLGQTRADASGHWSFTPNTPLADGPHDFVAVSLNAAGVPSEPSNAFRVVVDTQAPDTPSGFEISDDVGRLQGSLQSGDSTDDNTPTFSGSGANPGDTITVLDGGQPVGTAVVKPNGSWSLTPLTPLTPGAHEFTLTATDPAGNTSAPSAPFALTIDIAPPDAPTIGGVFDNMGAVIGEIAPGATTDDAKPTVWGSAEPGSTVEVFDGDTLLGRTTTGPDGYWTFTPTLPLLLGEHEITARAVDDAGNTSAASAPRDFNLMDDAPPSAPAIVNVMDDQGSVQGNVAKSTGITDDTQPSIRGTAEPGSLMTVRDGSTVLGTTTADSSGRWAFTPATPLADGPHAITVTATNAAGNISARTGVYDFVVDTQNPDAPNSVIALDNVGPVVGAISNGQTTDDATPGLSGTGEPGATVTIYDHDEPIGTALVKPDGTWQFTPTTPLQDGDHSLSTTQTDVAGNTGPASAPTNFTLDTKDVTAPTITALRDDVGTVQGAVQPDGVTDDTRPTLQGTAPAGTTVSVYDGSTLLGTAPTDSAGRWSFTPATPLADGPHAFTATATNAAGVVSPATAPYAVTVDTQGPAAPAITGLGDDVGTVQGELNDGARTDDTTPTLSGTGEPGATIKVYDGSDLIGTATVDPDGRWTLTPATPLTEGPHSFTATATDPAGNTGPASPVQSLVVDLTATAAPTLTIAEDANDNGVVNLAELSGKVDITIGLPAGARVGDVLNLQTSSGNQSLTITAEQLAAGRVLAQVDAPASGDTLIARVTLTDEAGNTSASAGDAAEFDYKTPDASTTALVLNPVSADNIVNAAEAGQTLQVSGQALGEFSTGDTVTLSINGKSFTGIVAQDGSFSIAVPGADLAADPDHTVAGSLRATDPAGNQADIGATRVFSVDTAATGAPTVTLVEDANNDGFINRAELQGLVNVKVDLPAGAAVGDRVDVSNGEVTNSLVLTAQDLATGHVLTGFVAPPTGSTVAITATLTDVAGNTSPQGSDSARVDTSGPSSATTGININPLTADNVINAAEAAGPVNVTGQATGEFKPGDVVTLTANGKTFTGTLGADGSFTVAVPGADLVADIDKTLDVSIRITDPAGNQADIPATRPYSVDTTATGAPQVTISEDANNNGFISRAELNGVIDVRVDLPAGTVAGDTLSVSNGSTTSTFTVTAAQAAAGFINTSFAAPAEGQLVQVTAILTDIAGNASPQGSDAARIDTTGPSDGPGGTTSLVLDSLSADNVINAAEAGGSVRVTGHATGEFTVGDTVTVEINGQSFSGQVAADGSFSIPVPGAELAVDPDKTVQASLRATDPAGNQADIAASRAYGVDISATGAPTVAIAEDANNNGFISRAELNGVVDVRVGLPAGTVAGDTLTVSNGTTTTDFVVTAAQVAAGHIDTSFAAPADGQMVNITAILTDIAGNASPQGADAARIDTTGPSAASTGITVNPVSADNIVNAAEAAGPVNVTGQATGEFTPGDVVTITANGKTFTGTLGADGSFTVAVPGADLVADGDKTLDVSIRITDPAGNQADIPATRAYSVDTAATGAPTVTISEDANNNGFISRAELNGVVDVRVGLPAGTVAGDTLTVSNGTTTTPITLTAEQVTAGFIDTSFAAPADGQMVNITAILTDIAGNASPQGADAAQIDTTGPSAATTGITVNPVSADNIVNAAEAAGPVNVTGQATGEFTPGDVVTITANGKNFTGTLGADGSFTVAVPGADLVADGDKTLDVSIRITDPAGNQADIPATRVYSVDTAATGAPVVTIAEDANNNGFINRAELNGVVDVRVGLPAGTVAGDTLTVSNGTTTTDFVVTAAQVAAGHIDTSFAAPADGQMVNITAVLTDIAGNASPQGSDAAQIDTTGPSSATTGITVNPVSADNIVNAAEAAGPVNVTGQATGEFTPGDVVTITANGKSFTGTLGADGSFTVAVPGADLVADGDKTLDVSIRITDPAGNQADIPATRAYSVDTAATGAPVVTIAEDANNNGFISRAELNGVVDVRVGLPAGTIAGDTLTVSNGTTTTDFVVTAAQVAAGHIDTSFAAPAEGQMVNITAILTDIAGNASPQGGDSARIDTTGPSAATTGITVNPVSADNIVNAAEAAGPVNVTGQATGEFKPGDVVTITANGKTFTGTLGADGSFTVAVPGADLVADADKTLDVSIRITDPAGNQADIPATRAYSVDTAATGAPTVTIAEDANNNGFISRAELNGVVDVRVGLPAGTVAGDTLTVSNGTTTTPITVTAAHLAAGFIDTSFAAPADGQMVNVTAILTDIAGNASPQGGDAARIDTTGPSAAGTGLVLDVLTADNVVNAAEAGGTVAVTGHATGEFTQGDTVTLTVNGKTFTGTVAANGSFSINVSGADLAADGDRQLDASLRATDAAGNQADIGASRVYSVDTTATGAPTVTIGEDGNNNGFINRAELNGVIDVRISLPAGAVAGDTLTVSNGSTTTPFTLTAAQVAAGFIDTSFAAPAEGSMINVTAILTDMAGNSSPQGSDSARLDTTATAAPTVTIAEDINNNGFISAAELAGQVDVRITLPAGAAAGDTLTVTDGTTQRTFTLTAAQVTAGQILTDFPPPAEGGVLNVTATLRDMAGNTSAPGSDSAQLDTTGPSGAGTSVTLDPLTADNVINAAESGAPVTVTGRATGEFAEGDRITLTVNGKTFTGTVAANGNFSVNVPGADLVADGDKTLDASLRATDAAGNQAEITASRPYTVDTTATGAPTVTITEDANNNAFISAAELSGDIGVRITLPAGAQQGDTLTVSDGTTTDRYVLNAAQLANGFIDTSFAAPAEGGTISVTATLTDVAGNTSAQGLDSARVDTTGPSGATTSITINPVTADNTVSTVEAAGSVNVTGQATGEFRTGDVVTITANGKAFTGILGADGSFTVPVSGSDLMADSDKTLGVSIRITDAAGNQADIPVTHTYSVDATPIATGSTLVGTEDTAMVFSWAQFGVADADTNLSGLSIKISSLPADGKLQLFNGSAWVAVTANQQVSATAINSGYLRFVPDVNESGSNSFTSAGTGNLKTDYASFRYSASDAHSASVDTTMTIDLTPQADTAQMALSISGGSVVSVSTAVSGNSYTRINYRDQGGESLNNNSFGVVVNGCWVQLISSDGSGQGGSYDIPASANWYFAFNGGSTSYRNNGGQLQFEDGLGGDADYNDALVAVSSYTYTETVYQNTAIGTRYDLNLSAALTDTDGSETLGGTVKIVLASAWLKLQNSAGTDLARNADGSYSVATNNLAGLKVYVPYGYVLGIVTAQATTVDTGGNSKTTFASTGITSLAAADLDAASDSGSSNTDNLTNLNKPSVTVASVPSGYSAVLVVDGVQVASTWNAATKTLIPVNALSEGAHTISYRLVDGSGAVSSLSAGSLNVTVDTGKPQPQMQPDLAASSDTGADSSDNITTNTRPVFNVAAPAAGETIKLYVDGIQVACTYTAGSVQPVTALSVGLHSISTTVTDAAGNESAASPSLAVHISSSIALSTAGNDLVVGSANSDGLALGGADDSTALPSADLTKTGLMSSSDADLTQADGSFTSDALRLNLTGSADVISGHGNVANAGAGNDLVQGGSGSDFIYGGAGNDVLRGAGGTDALRGGAGNDLLVGGQGNDWLRGDAGADVFAWELRDAGSNGAPAVDHIMDFNAAGGDVLDLRDLLQGEGTAGGTGNLSQFLDIDTTQSPGSTIIHISTKGGFTNGNYSTGAEDQTIVLDGVDLRSAMGLGADSSDSQLIQTLLNQGKLLTDNGG